jgi:hypothetical protein
MKPDIVSTGYCDLFQVQVLHRYFLNLGRLDFDGSGSPPPTAEEQALLDGIRQRYDVRSFLRLEPSLATLDTLRRHQLLWRLTAEGLRVAAPCERLSATEYHPLRPLPQHTAAHPADSTLTFLLYPTDPHFSTYTQLNSAELHELRIRDIPNPDPALAEHFPAGKVFVFAGAAPQLRLDAPGSGSLFGKACTEAWSAADAGAQQARPLALIRISCANLLDANGSLASPAFELRLPNRTTTWQYAGQYADRLPMNPMPVGDFPLVRHGRFNPTVQVPDGLGGTMTVALPNPTPGSTSLQTAVPAGATTADAFVSLIY